MLVHIAIRFLHPCPNSLAPYTGYRDRAGLVYVRSLCRRVALDACRPRHHACPLRHAWVRPAPSQHLSENAADPNPRPAVRGASGSPQQDHRLHRRGATHAGECSRALRPGDEPECVRSLRVPHGRTRLVSTRSGRVRAQQIPQRTTKFWLRLPAARILRRTASEELTLLPASSLLTTALDDLTTFHPLDHTTLPTMFRQHSMV